MLRLRPTYEEMLKEARTSRLKNITRKTKKNTARYIIRRC